jgi:prephenate dehydrogenase
MNTITDKTIGIIGYGNFGKVICKYLFPKNKIVLYTSQSVKEIPTHISIKNSLQEVVEAADIIIPAVPIREFEGIIKQLSPFVQPYQIIMDVCSVKLYPTKVMEKLLLNKVNVVATHPMFGPNSIRKKGETLKDLKIVTYNSNAKKIVYDNVITYFEQIGLEVIEMEPEEHDKIMARSQFFAMLVGQLAQKIDMRPTAIDTLGANGINKALQYMGKDKKIIEDMIRYNSYCKDVLENMITTLKGLRQE